MRLPALAFLLTLLAPLAVAEPGEPSTPAAPASGAAVVLPAPKTDGTFSLEKALHERRSCRAPAETPLTLEQIGQLCWAAQGVTDDKGHRTAPSAMASYPLTLYVLAGAVTDLAPGFYCYEPGKHDLALRNGGARVAEFEQKAVGQDWTARAPAIFVIAGRAEAMAKMKDRGAQFMWVEAGLAAQGFFLQATALGLGSTYVGGFDPEAARAALGLAEGEAVLAVLPVGNRS
jgi:SagB-type dehydrogenase family enzyme